MLDDTGVYIFYTGALPRFPKGKKIAQLWKCPFFKQPTWDLGAVRISVEFIFGCSFVKRLVLPTIGGIYLDLLQVIFFPCAICTLVNHYKPRFEIIHTWPSLVGCFWPPNVESQPGELSQNWGNALVEGESGEENQRHILFWDTPLTPNMFGKDFVFLIPPLEAVGRLTGEPTMEYPRR